MSDEELKVQDAIVNSLIDHYKAVIEQYKAENSEDKIIRQTLENFMRGLWEEIQVSELEYTTSEVYEMLEREIFTDNHVTIPSAEPYKGMTNGEVIKAMFPYVEVKDNCKEFYSVNIENLPRDRSFNTIGFTKDWWNSPYNPQESEKINV